MRAQESASQDRWLISYADFVTLLFAVFVVLFAFTWHTRQEFKAVSTAIHSGFESLSASAPAEQGRMETPPVNVIGASSSASAAVAASSGYDRAGLRHDLNTLLGEPIQRQEVVMHESPEGFVISLRELGFFHSGDAALLPEAAAKLGGIAETVKRRGLELRVEGHSDDQPIHNAYFQSNWELSTARAMSVLTMLVDGAGFPSNKISVAGYGAFRPIASNATAEGRRMNRRVDLVVIVPARATGSETK
jgi:chemotaxis protein MotB